MMSSRSLLAFAAIAVVALARPAGAQIPGIPLAGLLGRASDAALDKLAKPGAFAADPSIRIGLPGSAGALGGMMAMGGGPGAGLTNGLNAAAGEAASAAKPIFRAAIDHMSMQDAIGVVGGGGDAATRYLRRTAGAEIVARLTPLVAAALDKLGVLAQASKLSALGLNADALTRYATQKTADGVFTYMGQEEARLRQNPMSLGKMF